jgi:small subunit ribosomal protein S8
MTDPIADMLTRIRNAVLVKKTEVVLPLSKLKYEVAKILAKAGFIAKAEVLKGGGDEEIKKNRSAAFDQLKLTLKYDENGETAVSFLQRVSKPGRRVYADKNHIPQVLSGLGIAIISTSSGLMTNKEAFRKKIGGEILCEIY